MFEKFYTVSGVSASLGEQAQRGHCVACDQGNRIVYPWPMPGLGLRCAVCIIKESQAEDA